MRLNHNDLTANGGVVEWKMFEVPCRSAGEAMSLPQQFRHDRLLRELPSSAGDELLSRRAVSGGFQASGRCTGASAVAGFSTQLSRGVGSATR